jgi:hypothetical protein
MNQKFDRNALHITFNSYSEVNGLVLSIYIMDSFKNCTEGKPYIGPISSENLKENGSLVVENFMFVLLPSLSKFLIPTVQTLVSANCCFLQPIA